MPQLRVRKIALWWNFTSPWVTASCGRDGSLAVVQPLWVQPTAANHLHVNALDKVTAFPAVHTSMTGKCTRDVFGGSGFFAKATNHLGSRGCILDTTFGPGYDVTKPLVLTGFEKTYPLGNVSRRWFHLHDYTLRALRKKFHRKLVSSCSRALHSGTPLCFVEVEHSENPSSCGTTSHGTSAAVCIFGSPRKTRPLFLVGNVDRGLHRIARRCAGTSGRCSVSVFQDKKNMFIPKASASRSGFCSSRDHTRPLHLPLALAMVLTMNARRFQRTHSGMRYFTQRVKRYWRGSY